LALLVFVSFIGILALVSKRDEHKAGAPRPAVSPPAPPAPAPDTRSYIPPSERPDFLVKPGQSAASPAKKAYIPHHRYVFDQAADAYRELGNEFAKAIAEGRSWVMDDGRVVVITGD
jgi:hypothetical protein